MYIIDLNYIVPLPKLDDYMANHVKFLKKYYKLNVFVASGRKVPRTGGIILALAANREEIDKIVSEDPFYIHRLAEFTITEFLTSQYHSALKGLVTGKPDG
ncbi:MAG: YciI family protein [Chryseolinea sp.]